MNPLSKRNLTWAIGLLSLAFLALSGCASNAPLDTLDPAGRKSEGISDLINPVFIIAGVVFGFLQGAVVYICWKFNVKAPKKNLESLDGGYKDEELPEQVQ